MTTPAESDRSRVASVLPVPAEVDRTSGEYRLSETTTIRYDSAARPVAEYLADLLRPPTGYDLPLAEASGADRGSQPDTVSLLLSDDPVDPDAGARAGAADEGYRLDVTDAGATVRAADAAGLFRGVQTLRQLLPPAVESDRERAGPWRIPGVEIVDYPRFPYRGAHLDVARHFFTVAEVTEFVDLVAQYKVNHLHLHLTDNEGWRLEIDGWPELTGRGAETDIDGGEGGYYTRSEYEEIVAYAASRYVTVVPEIDVPAHTGAATAAYPELSRGDPPESMPADSGTLDPDAEVTYEFLEDVLGQVAALTPGPYVHVGADEADDMSAAEYDRFLARLLPIVAEQGKTPVGWQEVVGGGAPSSTVVQYWKEADIDPASDDASGEAKAAPDYSEYQMVLSPRSHCYLNFRYAEEVPPDGPETWGRRIASVPTSYDWDPGSHVDGVDESAVLGTETALWSEKLATTDDVEFMAFPRIAGVAERGWSPDAKCDWEGYERRLAAQAPRWDHLGIEYYRSPAVDWPS